MEKHLTVTVYSPYLPKHFGGGEKHILSVVSLLLKKQVHVTVWVDPTDDNLERAKQKYSDYFHLNLGGSVWQTRPQRGILDKLGLYRREDIHYAVTDGSIYIPNGKKNILHIQVPFTHGLNPWESCKLSMWQTIQTNSQFTADVIEDRWGRQPEAVVHPAVDDDFFSTNAKKGKYILGVGRFFKQLHSKRQDVLIQAFKKLLEDERASGYSLVLIGAVEDEEYYLECLQAARDLPVEFITKASRDDVINWCGKARFYWHATGYGIDEGEHPELAEHFGISTAEAMAAGAIPLVVPKGGQREILGEKSTELGWYSDAELVKKTTALMESVEARKVLRAWAQQQVKQFDTAHFSERISQLFGV